MVIDNQFYNFYKGVFITSFIPYLSYAFFPLIPDGVAGFSLTGWAWLFMLLIAIFYFLENESVRKFPLIFWLPWVVYLFGYLLIDFSFPGLQLTLQYSLPILVGFVASGFTYTREKLHWLYKKMLHLSLFVVAMCVFGWLYRDGWTPNTAANPMLLSVMAAVSIGAFYLSKKWRFLFVYIVLFMVPFLELTRMALLVFVVILAFHFANRTLLSKLLYAVLGILFGLFVFSSEEFQEKTFKEGTGELSDISINYYESEGLNTSGRTTFMEFYKPGLRASPIWGNGPRSDIDLISRGLGLDYSVELSNDYITVRYNYGYVGLVLLLFGFCCTFFSLYMKLRDEKDAYKILVYSTSMVLFFSFLLFMYTDNILKYTIFFPNFFFVLIGMSYASFQETERK